ncbi:MAG: hypothetical protein O7E55_06640, partial [Chloroflexi bacterium]|nr:hypothetical protein [Chloroflexota bacterium]
MIQRLLIIWFVFGISAAVLVPSAMPGSGSSASPRSFKERALDRLTPFVDESELINKAVASIEKSLDTEFWEDDFHLVPKKGHKVFDRERHAVKELEHLVEKAGKDKGKDKGKGKDADLREEIIQASRAAIDDLLDADHQLALTIIEEAAGGPAADPKRQKKIDKELAKANKELAKGDDNRDGDQPVNAVQ